MSRFSPQVLPDWGDKLSAALGAGVGSYLQYRQRKLDTEKEMFGQGYQPADASSPPTKQPPVPADTHPGMQPPVVDTHPAMQPTGATTGTDLAAALGTPGNFKGRGGMPPIGDAKPSAAMPSTITEPAPTTAAMPDYLSQPVHLMGRDWTMTEAAKARARLAMALSGAEIGQKNATAYKDMREGGALRLGDPGYAGAMGDVAGAQELAKLPADMRRMVLQGKISLATALATERARAGTEYGLEGMREGFAKGQQGRQQTFEAGQTERKGEIEYGNKVGEIGYTQSGQVGPTIVRGARAVMGLPAPTPSARFKPLPQRTGTAVPATTGALPPLTPEQIERATNEPDYAQFLKAKGYE